jgi:hypothetical protein
MKEIVGSLIAFALGVVGLYAAKSGMEGEQFEKIKFILSSLVQLGITFGFVYYYYKYHSLKKSLIAEVNR